MSTPMLCRVDEGTQALAADFFALGEAGEWHIQECLTCAAGFFPPRLRCPKCGGAALRWEPIGKSAQLVSVVYVHGENARHKPARALRRPEGYATAIVAPNDWPHVRFPVLIEGVAAAQARVGMRVDLGSTAVGKHSAPSGTLQRVDR